MNKRTATNLIRKTFEGPYNRDNFLSLTKNLFHSFESATFVYRGNDIPDAYKKQIRTLERIGKYKDKNNNKIDILSVCLTHESALDRARTLQRNFISWYLNGSRGDVTKDAALVAFYVEGTNDWRLSLVKMEYRLGKSDAGKLKTYTELTPARRFSFLVGKEENTHTAQRQLIPILLEEDAPPTLDDLENAFSVEVVTKEFFEKYKRLFLNTKEALEKIIEADTQIKEDFQKKNIETVDFTKKLLGQIVFLYFLQKKGWFGVGLGKDWGTGSKTFLRDLFDKKALNYNNYFNDVLEPLFYDALARDRSDVDHFNPLFKCKIPFLNGGLFDPLNNYGWTDTEINLSNKLFSNDERTKEGDRGTGILDVFDRYNFTVKEDEPLEKEVAVDPEMLGKVFENLLEVKDRKSKGTYYTPREIVHYMCQESLINYLVTELKDKVNREDIVILIQIGESAVEHDTKVTEAGEETDTYSYKLPASIRKNAEAIDKALKNIRVCDPAVGSGAFLVGMMTVITKTRNTLTSYLNSDGRTIYRFKHNAIKNSLYGVDIDPGATEIAKLRLWLSLIVDEQDIKRIKPLPNLDYKIMQGNSLLEEYEGIKLFDEKLVTKSIFDNSSLIAEVKEKMNELQREYFDLHSKGDLQENKRLRLEAELKRYSDRLKNLTKTPKIQVARATLFDQESEVKAEELKKLHKDFFDTAPKKEKDEMKKQIEALTWELIEVTLKEQNKEPLLTQIEKFKISNIRPFFLWKLNFSEVFESKNGFDVIIANPPYIRVQSMKKSTKNAYKKKYVSATNSYDIYVLFDELAASLLGKDGFFAFIQPNKFFSSDYGVGIRNLLGSNEYVHKIVDFGASQMFDTATTYTCLLFCSNARNPNFDYVQFNTDKITTAFLDYVDGLLNSQISTVNLKSSYLKDDGWFFGTHEEIKLYEKLELNSTPLSNIAEATFQGIVTSADPVYILEKRGGRTYSKLLRKDVDIENEFLKPLLKGSDINRYANTINKHWLIFPYELLDNIMKLIPPKVFSFKYPKTWDYLKSCEKHLRSREKGKMNHDSWYAYVYPKNLDKFEKPKILIQVLARKAAMTADEEGKYYFVGGGNAGGYGLTIKKNGGLTLRYLLALLNSSTLDFYLQHHSSKFQNGYFSYAKRFLKRIPIKVANNKQQGIFEKLVDKILSLKHQSNSDKVQEEQIKNLEIQLNHMVYELYNLSPKEIDIVEKNTN